MNATRKPHDLGQRLWLDNITRGLVTSGTLARYIKDFSVTGLTSNPTIFDHAISGGDFYDEAMRADAGDAEAVLAEFARAGVDNAALAARLQRPDWKECAEHPVLRHDGSTDVLIRRCSWLNN